MKNTILMATGALVAAGFATEASAVNVDVYGQVNKAVTYADNGATEETNISDNDVSSTRIGVKGEQLLDNGLTASVLLEMELEGDSTNGDLLADAGDITGSEESAALTERHARVGLAGDFGAVFVGHTSTATDGIAEIDMAGVSDLMTSDLTTMVGVTALSGTTTAVDDQGTASTADDVATPGTFTAQDVEHLNFDGGRGDVISYLSPVVNGFQGAVSVTDNGDTQTAVRYNGVVEGVKLSAGLGYANHTIDTNNTAVGTAGANIEILSGSISAVHESGVAATFSYGTAELKGSSAEPENMYFKVGYTMDALEIAADYTMYDNDLAGRDNVETTAYGVGAQYNLGNGVSVAAAYKLVETDNGSAKVGQITTSDNVEDLDVFAASLRVKF